MTQKRSKLELYVDVLRVIKKGSHKPTRIMYRANLSWNPLTEILESLTEQGLTIREILGRHNSYKITSKGRNVLNYFDQAAELMKIH